MVAEAQPLQSLLRQGQRHYQRQANHTIPFIAAGAAQPIAIRPVLMISPPFAVLLAATIRTLARRPFIYPASEGHFFVVNICVPFFGMI